MTGSPPTRAACEAGKGDARRSPGRLATWGRAALYFPAIAVVFVAVELGFRAWAIPCPSSRSEERSRRFNVLTQAWGRALTWLTETVLGARVELRGVLPEGRFVIVANHQSSADIIFLIARLAPKDLKFVAKDTLGRRIPSVSTALRHGGSALIRRDGGRADLRALAEMGRRLESWDASAVVFAEGTRRRDGLVAAFQPAGARIVARESGLPLLPLCIEGTHVASDLRGFVRGMPGARIILTVGEPVDAPGSAVAFAETIAGIERWCAETIAELRSGCAASPPRHAANAVDEPESVRGRGEVLS